ncbi:MAG: hypothetical protein DI598_12150 [Pseudopedobacter saltans]|uniref:CCDC81-like prokaryotic HU domain-containing protein n=1 Tax=Pseudopedobacter saltans TaxID=151895 RepID=A0A2W5GSX8_9SPHI|nr:MAG: hypothetical protein DI598_12150 [Pseudopedobacter saltans]
MADLLTQKLNTLSNHISVLIHDFLIEKKEISLEKIGSLHLKQSTVTTEGGQTFPEVEFVYDKTAITTPELVDFAAEKEGKNKAIIKSDIDYFLEENRQLMNIGTGVLMIPDLGYIHSLKTGGYSFSQQPISGFRDSEMRKKVLSGDIYDRTLDASATENTPLRFKNPSTSRSGMSNLIGIIVILLVLGGVGFGIYYFVNHAKLKPNNEEALASSADTAKVISSNSKGEDSTPETPAADNQEDSQDIYKFVFEVTKDGERAHSRIAKLRAYGDKVAYDSVQTTEGLYFRLYSPIPKTADTARAKDSLFRYFQKPIQIAKHN